MLKENVKNRILFLVLLGLLLFLYGCTETPKEEVPKKEVEISIPEAEKKEKNIEEINQEIVRRLCDKNKKVIDGEGFDPEFLMVCGRYYLIRNACCDRGEEYFDREGNYIGHCGGLAGYRTDECKQRLEEKKQNNCSEFSRENLCNTIRPGKCLREEHCPPCEGELTIVVCEKNQCGCRGLTTEV